MRVGGAVKCIYHGVLYENFYILLWSVSAGIVRRYMFRRAVRCSVGVWLDGLILRGHLFSHPSENINGCQSPPKFHTIPNLWKTQKTLRNP